MISEWILGYYEAGEEVLFVLMRIGLLLTLIAGIGMVVRCFWWEGDPLSVSILSGFATAILTACAYATLASTAPAVLAALFWAVFL